MEKQDPYLWLEEIEGERALAWASARNEASLAELTAWPGFERLQGRLLKIYESDERIPYAHQMGGRLYNFWQDETNVRGLWRRTTWAEYRKDRPDWETLFDLDALAAAEGEDWVWKGFVALEPSYERGMVALSRGGGDAVVLREYDLETKAFLSDGFALPEAKSTVSWRDRNTLYVATDFGPGTLTDSGYPREVRLWRRGEDLDRAETVISGEKTDMMTVGYVVQDRGRVHEFLDRRLSFYTAEMRVRRGSDWVLLDRPADSQVDTFGGQMLLTLRSDWTLEGRTYPAGALLAIDFDAFLEGALDFQVLFEPDERRVLSGVSGTRNCLFVNVLDNVRNRILAFRRRDGEWSSEPLDTPDLASLSIWGVAPEESDDYWLQGTDFLTPSTLYLGRAGEETPEAIKRLPAFFPARDLQVEQREAVSADGTRIPYFQVASKDLALDGGNPTLLQGYGGFEVPYTAAYALPSGPAWLEEGGVLVVANIRGGGEFGPRWHQAALHEKRQRAYDDFIAVAEDLIARGVTSPQRLGISGGSNGGLLVGNVLVQRPDLLGAVVCSVPLLDMRRYHKLLAGASWMAEYGDPDDPADWNYLKDYSPYHLVCAGADYPRVFFKTSTRDDRVHPGHARKMAARMEEQGHAVLYYENMEGGHAGAADNRQRARIDALAYAFLWNELAGA